MTVSPRLSHFPELRKRKAVYVDKTDRLHALLSDADTAFYLLCRPRGFGKTLMLSTLEAISQGRRDLFDGLAISRADYDWRPYPVLHLSLAFLDTGSVEAFGISLATQVRKALVSAGAAYDPTLPPEANLAFAFDALARQAGRPLVVLIDAYDAPITQTLNDATAISAIHARLAGLYGQIRENADKIRFMMVTGVMRLSGDLGFPALDNLVDLTFDDQAATLLGYTESELEANFAEPLRAQAKRAGLSREAYRSELRQWCGSYRFSREDKSTVLNPTAVATALADRQGCLTDGRLTMGRAFVWPGSLRGRDLTGLGRDQVAGISEEALALTGLASIQPMAMLYQAGYLTIKERHPHFGYTLGVPGEGIRQDLCALIIRSVSDALDESYLDASRLALLTGDFPGFFRLLGALYARLPQQSESEGHTPEFVCQYFLRALLVACGLRIAAKECPAQGRAGLVAEALGETYVFGLRIGGTASEALTRLRDRAYAAPYLTSGKQIHLVGLAFDPATRRLADAVAPRESIRLFVVCHKPTPLPVGEPFVPIQVGTGKPIPGVALRDDTGDNIARKNPNFCELTAQYWIWKNIRADVVGLCHYRRIPSFSGCLDATFSDFSEATCARFGWDLPTIQGLLSHYDILMPPNWLCFPPGEPGHVMTPYQFHAYEHRESDIAESLRVIHDLTPEMDAYAHRALCVDTSECFGNICVMRKPLFDAYSAWLFKILFEVERRVDIPKNREQARLFGFLSERLIMVWLAYAQERLGARVWFAKMIPLGDFPEPTAPDIPTVPPREAVPNPRLSVIIPVYNTEKYLPKCLHSVCTQCEEEIEIICVDDESTDTSPEILRHFAERDGRIRIIRQKNGGPGKARNRGIAEAKGDYLAFVDSDDWVDRFIWFRSLRKAEHFKLDMVLFEPQDIISETGEKVINAWNETRFAKRCYAGPFTWRDIGRSPFDTCCYLPNRIVRRDFFGNRRFPEHHHYEDAAIHIDLLLSAKRLGAFACPFYFYRIHQDSRVHAADERVLDHLKIIDEVAAILRKNGLFEELREPFLRYAALLLLRTYALLPTRHCAERLRDWALERADWRWGKADLLTRQTHRAILLRDERFLAIPYSAGATTLLRALGAHPLLADKRLRGVLKQALPYGLMCLWLRERYGIVEDKPLLAYPGAFKRAKRLVKFALPYGLVAAWKRADTRNPSTTGLIPCLRRFLRPRGR